MKKKLLYMIVMLPATAALAQNAGSKSDSGPATRPSAAANAAAAPSTQPVDQAKLDAMNEAMDPFAGGNGGFGRRGGRSRGGFGGGGFPSGDFSGFGGDPSGLAEVAAGVDATALAAVPVVLEEGRADLVGDLAVLAVVPVASDAAAAPLFSRRFRMI